MSLKGNDIIRWGLVTFWHFHFSVLEKTSYFFLIWVPAKIPFDPILFTLTLPLLSLSSSKKRPWRLPSSSVFCTRFPLSVFTMTCLAPGGKGPTETRMRTLDFLSLKCLNSSASFLAFLTLCPSTVRIWDPTVRGTLDAGPPGEITPTSGISSTPYQKMDRWKLVQYKKC